MISRKISKKISKKIYRKIVKLKILNSQTKFKYKTQNFLVIILIIYIPNFIFNIKYKYIIK